MRVAVLVAAATVALAACGVTDIPRSPRTVTVYVDGPDGSSAPAPASSVATVEPPSPTGVPTRLAAGRQRGAPHSFDEAQARIEAAKVGREGMTAFRSPSGNIFCSIGADSSVVAACEVESGRITPPVESICGPDDPKDIGRIELSDKGARPVCNSDSIRQDGVPELRYGTRTDPSLGTVACLSEESGMTCVDSSSRHGFFIARETFVTF